MRARRWAAPCRRCAAWCSSIPTTACRPACRPRCSSSARRSSSCCRNGSAARARCRCRKASTPGTSPSRYLPDALKTYLSIPPQYASTRVIARRQDRGRHLPRHPGRSRRQGRPARRRPGQPGCARLPRPLAVPAREVRRQGRDPGAPAHPAPTPGEHAPWPQLIPPPRPSPASTTVAAPPTFQLTAAGGHHAGAGRSGAEGGAAAAGDGEGGRRPGARASSTR